MFHNSFQSKPCADPQNTLPDGEITHSHNFNALYDAVPPDSVRKTGKKVRHEPHLVENSPVVRRRGRLDLITGRYTAPLKHDLRDRFITKPKRNSALSFGQRTPSQPSVRQSLSVASALEISLNSRVLYSGETPKPPLSNGCTEPVDRISFASPLHIPPPRPERKLERAPVRILDAPELSSDFYLNVLDWSPNNMIGIALGPAVYLLPDTGKVVRIGQTPAGSFVSSVAFRNSGRELAVGLSSGEIQIWDVATSNLLRTVRSHTRRVLVFSGYGDVLSSGDSGGIIRHHDVRTPEQAVATWHGHKGSVCGLKWREEGGKNGTLCASSGNDCTVSVWDGRFGNVTGPDATQKRWKRKDHTAAVKALAWCPWDSAVLAAGGGTADKTIKIYNTNTQRLTHTKQTLSQITSLIFSRHTKELLSTHGFSGQPHASNAIMLHSVPSMRTVAEIQSAHSGRVLYSALSPCGGVVATAAEDDTLKFWNIWDVPKVVNPWQGGTGQKTKSGVLTLR